MKQRDGVRKTGEEAYIDRRGRRRFVRHDRFLSTAYLDCSETADLIHGLFADFWSNMAELIEYLRALVSTSYYYQSKPTIVQATSKPPLVRRYGLFCPPKAARRLDFACFIGNFYVSIDPFRINEPVLPVARMSERNVFSWIATQIRPS